MPGDLVIYTAIASVIRYILICSDFSILKRRVEVSTPLNSFMRMKEGVYLLQNGVDPYAGDMIHEGPLLLRGHVWLFETCPHLVPYLYIAMDIITGLLLLKAVRNWVQEKYNKERRIQSSFAPGTKNIQLQKLDLDIIPKYVFLAYIFNPFTILNCASLTTTVFSNLFLGFYFYFMSAKKLQPCLLFLALETTRNLYPLVLVSPVILIFSKGSLVRAFRIALEFVALCVGISFINFKLIGEWTFLDGTLGFIFFYRDLQPNIGLFWYFFTEMFEHFRPMFLVTFQMNATLLYLVPLSIKLRKDPLMLSMILCTLMTIFKSYPSFGDIGFYVALIPMWRRYWKFMMHNFVVLCFFLITVLIMPALWYLWIYAGSANANFYFGATLAFSTGQIFLVTDLSFAYIKREFCLLNGQKFVLDGKEAKIVLE